MSKSGLTALISLVIFVLCLGLGIVVASNSPLLALITLNISGLALVVSIISGIIALIGRLKRERRDSGIIQH